MERFIDQTFKTVEAIVSFKMMMVGEVNLVPLEFKFTRGTLFNYISFEKNFVGKDECGHVVAALYLIPNLPSRFGHSTMKRYCCPSISSVGLLPYAPEPSLDLTTPKE